MSLYGLPGNEGGFWLAPVLVGVLLILIGVLLFVWPKLLSFVLASVFVVAGCGVIGAAWRMRRHVSYQRIERQWQVHDQEPPPP